MSEASPKMRRTIGKKNCGEINKKERKKEINK